MGRYLKEAKHHAERIKYYFNYGGSMGYSQAKNHYLDLAELIMRASQSKSNKNDAILIQGLRDSVEKFMEEMKEREEK